MNKIKYLKDLLLEEEKDTKKIKYGFSEEVAVEDMDAQDYEDLFDEAERRHKKDFQLEL